MQSVAQAWLVLHLTGSGVDLGIVVGLQFLPMLLFGPFGGLVADRVDKRRLLFATQTAGGLLALVLGILVVTGTPCSSGRSTSSPRFLGVVNLFDNPARQSFVIEMVGRDDLPNAVSLNSVVMNASRVIGPAIGGIIITLFGLSVCFFVNAASYVAVVIGLAMMRVAELRPTEPVARGPGGRFARGSGTCGGPRHSGTRCSPVALIGIFVYNFTVTLALLAKVTFGGGAGAYSLLTSCMGIGAVVGGLFAAHRARPTPRLLQVLALALGALLALVALSPTLLVACLSIVAMGAASIGFIATANATLQLTAEPEHARTGDGALRDGVPRDDPDRRAPRRRDRPVDRPEGRTARRVGVGGCRGGRARLAPPECTSARPAPRRETRKHAETEARAVEEAETTLARPA